MWASNVGSDYVRASYVGPNCLWASNMGSNYIHLSRYHHQNRWTVGLVTPRWFGCDQPILSLFRFRCHIQTRGGLLDQPSNGFGGDILTDLCLNPCNLPKRSLNPRNLPSRSPNPRYLLKRKSNPCNSALRSPKLRYSDTELQELIYFLISTNRPCELTC